MMRVTFDSNVWRIVASPDRFPDDEFIDSFRKIRQAIMDKKIIACLAETIFTLEAIQKKNRKSFLTTYEPNIKCSEEAQADGSIKLSISIEPDRKHHPVNNLYLSSHLEDAINIGFKLLRCPRIAGIVNPDIKEDFFLSEDHVPIKERQDTFSMVQTEIEQNGSGIQHIKSIGEKYNSSNWIKGIEESPECETGNIKKAVAEWADGDSIAAHLAYKNDFFCTRDIGKSGGAKSVLSSKNRKWLEAKYNIVILPPEELALKIL